jgi:hypothetical protein
MSTINYTVRHRPVRIGFLVRPGDVSDLEKTAALCCLLWGGLHNPIIPVATETDGSADELVRTFQVDAVGQSGEIDKFRRAVSSAEKPLAAPRSAVAARLTKLVRRRLGEKRAHADENHAEQHRSEIR